MFLRASNLDPDHMVGRYNDDNFHIPVEASTSLDVVSLVSRRIGMRVQSSARIPSLLTSESTIWNILSSYGGEWVWGQVEHDLQDIGRVNILLSCLLNKSLVCVSDGSFNPDNQDICGVGWILGNESTPIFSGSFVEKSNSASSYRAELLGILTLFSIFHATAEYFNLKD